MKKHLFNDFTQGIAKHRKYKNNTIFLYFVIKIYFAP